MEKSPPRSYKKQQKIEKEKLFKKRKKAQSNQHQSIFEHNKKS